MHGGGQTALGVLTRLLSARGLSCPDSRPLYLYRFTRDEYEMVGAFLRAQPAPMLLMRDCAALVIMHTAEWFRRDRVGGHWDWKRPLRQVGLRYGDTHRSNTSYSNIVSIVDRGFGYWRRPPAGSDRIFSVVRESGFPSAAIRDNPRIAIWLRKAVLAVERGFEVGTAVRNEAWRVAESIATTLFEAAERLCSAVVTLRRLLPERGSGPVEDPVVALDRLHPSWREELPFDVELADVRELVESIVRARQGGADALQVARWLVRRDGPFREVAEVELEGALNPSHLPPLAVSAIRNNSRPRLIPRAPLGQGVPIAGVEKVFEEGGDESWELRRYVSSFEAAHPLDCDVRLMLVAGDRLLTEFVAFGGEPHADQVLALHVEAVDDMAKATRLRVLGASPVMTSRPMLGLAIDPTVLDSVEFSEGFEDLGTCQPSNRVIVQFSGTAKLRNDTGTIVWRTGAKAEEQDRLILVGDLVPRVREPVFRGMPMAFIERDGVVGGLSRSQLRVRPVSAHADGWSTMDGGTWGRVRIALLKNDEIETFTTADVVPPGFRLDVDRPGRKIIVSGKSGASVGASGGRPLRVAGEQDRTIIDLSQIRTGDTLKLALRWESEIALSIFDPLLDKELLSPNGHPMAPRSRLSLDALAGHRLVCSTNERICIELSAGDARTMHLFRNVEGEVPLSAYAEDIIRLVGGSELLDAEVRISWVGASDRMAEVRWFGEDINPFVAPANSVFAGLANLAGLQLEGFSLADPPSPSVPVERALHRDMADRLASSAGEGPWMLHGSLAGSGSIRPHVVPRISGLGRATEIGVLAAVQLQDAYSRERMFDALLSRPEDMTMVDRRYFIELACAARSRGLPFCAFDALKALARHPRAAVYVLWACERMSERAAVLGIQRELPFLWAATRIEDWQSAVEERLQVFGRRLEESGLAANLVALLTETALSEQLEIRPELSQHARAVYLCQLRSDSSESAELARRLSSSATLAISEHEILLNDFIERHARDGILPGGSFDHGLLRAVASSWEPYHAEFTSLLAAPFLAAESARGRLSLDRAALGRCRDAWVLDPYYFEKTVLFALEAGAQTVVAKDLA